MSFSFTNSLMSNVMYAYLKNKGCFMLINNLTCFILLISTAPQSWGTNDPTLPRDFLEKSHEIKHPKYGIWLINQGAWLSLDSVPLLRESHQGARRWWSLREDVYHHLEKIATCALMSWVQQAGSISWNLNYCPHFSLAGWFWCLRCYAQWPLFQLIGEKIKIHPGMWATGGGVTVMQK